MVKYIFKDSPLVIQNAKRANAQKIGEALDKIKRETAGRFNSKTVLDAARNESNYLHRFFEWQDSVAAEKFRQEQARELVSCIDIVVDEKKNQKLPAFISLIERDGRGYRTAQEVLDSVELQAIALRQAEADFLSYEKRLAQFSEICDAIKETRRLIAERRRASEGQTKNA